MIVMTTVDSLVSDLGTNTNVLSLLAILTSGKFLFLQFPYLHIAVGKIKCNMDAKSLA